MGVAATTDLPPNLKPGTVLDGRYRLDRMLGKGGVGWVFRAKHLELDSEVAIKLLQTMFAEHSMMRPRFVREARAMAALKHPHIVTITDFSVSAGQPYIVMELLEGHTLYEEIDRGPFDPERARRVMGRVLDGLAYAHGKGFVHRDIKPDNLFLLELKSDDAFPKILDFGFVKLMNSEPQAPSDVLTRSGIAFGTPAYMSPEQATGAPADRRSDLYSLGIVFYEMLAGQRPYQGTLPEIVRQHLTAPVPTFAQLGVTRRESPALREFLARAMAKEPGQRFDNATQMKEALLALPTPYLESVTPAAEGSLSSAPTVAALPRGRHPSASGDDAASELAPRRKRLPWLGLLLGLAIVGYVVLGPHDAWPAALRPSDEPTPTEPAVSGAAVTQPPAATDPAATQPAATQPAAAGADADSEGVDLPALAVELVGGAVERLRQVGSTPETSEVVVEDAAVVPEVVPGEATLEPAEASGDTRPDPWRRRAPAWITRARRRVLAGRSLGSRTEDALKRYARTHRGDVRPHLLLAQSFRRRGWDASAMERYDLAHRIDPGAAGDPQMLDDLVRMSARSTDTRRAAALVRSVYGAAARASVEAALAESGYSREERAKLRRLRRRL